jgi:hypothetical protein
MKWHQVLQPVLLVLLVLIVIALFALGIAQPFLWKEIFKESPPADISTFSSLITVVLALLVLGVGAFGALAFYFLREVLKASLEQKLEQKLRVEMNVCLARAQGSVAYSCWRTWLIAPKDYALLESAIANQQGALGLIDEQKLKELSRKEQEAIYQQKSNLAGYIAYKHRHFKSRLGKDEIANEIKTARKASREAYLQADNFGDNYDWKANYAGVLKTFGTQTEKEEADKIISELQQKHSTGEITKDEMQDYQQLWS